MACLWVCEETEKMVGKVFYAPLGHWLQLKCFSYSRFHSKLVIIYLPEDNSVPNHNVVITRSSANTVWGLV